MGPPYSLAIYKSNILVIYLKKKQNQFESYRGQVDHFSGHVNACIVLKAEHYQPEVSS